MLSQGEFVPGEPYLFATDLDGYEFEIWFELPTPVDPPVPRAEVEAAASSTPHVEPRPVVDHGRLWQPYASS